MGDEINGEDQYDRSGESVSLSADGSVVAIGSTWADDAGTNAGHVRVLQYNGTTWTHRGYNIDGEAANDRCGHAVSLSADGSIVSTGAIQTDASGENAGQVRVFEAITTDACGVPHGDGSSCVETGDGDSDKAVILGVLIGAIVVVLVPVGLVISVLCLKG